MGVIAIIATQILKSSVEGSSEATTDTAATLVRLSQEGPAAVLYLIALAVVYKFDNRYTAVVLLVSVAAAGQFIFV